jgi:ActR/RegA family two-component response regulator
MTPQVDADDVPSGEHLMDDRSKEGNVPLATTVVDGLLARHGVAQRQRQQVIAQTLGIPYQGARRRMLGSPPFTFEEVNTVASRFGETLQSSGASQHEAEPPQPATFVAKGLHVECSAWVGDKAELGRPGPLVAIRPIPDQLNIVPAADATGVPSYEVLRVEIIPRRKRALRVAILDDDRDIAMPLVEFLVAHGIEATPFFTIKDLVAAISVEPFNGYVLDWLLDNQSVRPLIANIRSTDPDCGIVILTGQIDLHRVDESDIGIVADTYRVSYQTKPARLGAVMSALKTAMRRPEGA